ncbi:unnamed protein product, partial [Notodromas monacha]
MTSCRGSVFFLSSISFLGLLFCVNFQPVNGTDFVVNTNCNETQFVEGEKEAAVSCSWEEISDDVHQGLVVCLTEICSSNQELLVISSIINESQGLVTNATGVAGNYSEVTFFVTARKLGFAELWMNFCVNCTRPCGEIKQSCEPTSVEGHFEREVIQVSVIRDEQIIDTVFTVSLVCLVVIAYINMGSTLDLSIVKANLKRPKGPAVGLFCQYIFMPLMSFGLGYVFLKEDTALRLALLVVGCSPGGGASNIWTVLLNGNVNLSVTMTFVSAIVSFASMPAWIYSLGPQISDEEHFKIPYGNVASSTLSFIIPTGIGLLVNRKWPKAGKWMRKILKPFGAFFILYAATFGVYANWYAVDLVTWQ